MTEITRQLSIYICKKCDCAGCADCNKGIDKNSKTIAGLTKERDDLEHYIKKRMEVADKIFKENRDLKSKLSNRDKEIEELKHKNQSCLINLTAVEKRSATQKEQLKALQNMNENLQDHLDYTQCFF